jgi:hypothetical protein
MRGKDDSTNILGGHPQEGAKIGEGLRMVEIGKVQLLLRSLPPHLMNQIQWGILPPSFAAHQAALGACFLSFRTRIFCCGHGSLPASWRPRAS